MVSCIAIVEALGVPRENVEKNIKENISSSVNIIWKTVEELSKEDKANVDAIISVKTRLSDSILCEFPSLKVIAVAFTGYDSVDMTYCRNNNIQVFNVPAYSTDSVAELVIGLTISLLRDIPRGDELIRSGGWNLGFAGTDLNGKTVGFIGTGAIGIRTAELFKAFKCELVAWSRSQRDEFTSLGGKYLETIEQVFKTADIVTIHIPSNSSTKGLVSKEVLSYLQPHALLINCARGAIIDQSALTEALNAKKFRAGIDVFETEPTPQGEPLLQVDRANSVFTPHIAYKTNEALQRRAAITVTNLQNFAAGKDTNRVDKQ